MSIMPKPIPKPVSSDLPLLSNGDRMTQAEFHWRYEQYPDDVKFELIGGTVFMASPLSREHAHYFEELSYTLGHYQRATPGIELLPDATNILSEESEPRPDLTLRILQGYGGQSRDEKYVGGAPEFLAEVAYSSRAVDLHQKKADYQQAGVLEYLVLCVEERELHWFSFQLGRPLTPNAKGVYRSRIFPGLWIHGPALLARDSARVSAVLQQGLASREHAALVKRLQLAHRKRSSS